MVRKENRAIPWPKPDQVSIYAAYFSFFCKFLYKSKHINFQKRLLNVQVMFVFISYSFCERPVEFKELPTYSCLSFYFSQQKTLP